MSNSKKYLIIFGIGWLLTNVSIVIISNLIFQELTNETLYWVRVSWTMILNTIIWTSLGFNVLLSENKTDSIHRYGGISPSILFVVFFYAILSFVVMVLFGSLIETNTISNYHIVIQIILFTSVALILSFTLAARLGATSGVNFDRNKSVPPSELHDLINSLESQLIETNLENLKSELKSLREFLKYSLSQSSSLSNLNDYHLLSNDIVNILNEIEKNITLNTSLDINCINSLTQEVSILKKRAKIIANKLKR